MKAEVYGFCFFDGILRTEAVWIRVLPLRQGQACARLAPLPEWGCEGRLAFR